ncbi:ABC transporter permease [Sediminispirochaeta bajacaliforniensis]|uniref:ABC transporter permease n=1 Tax=Sediminispirochaeta bajacaliforniensis TaxID=148 RepID=UPI00037923C4|nr:ABC transporter permease [Sediminispirochaeta bajacaliforniensis]
MFSELIHMIFSQDFLASCIRLATPLLLASMGGIFSERSGVLFLGLEGFMLMGAFFGFLGSYYLGAVQGIVLAVLFNMIIALVYAFCTVTLAVDQVVVSVSVNILGLGITGAFSRVLFGAHTQQLMGQRLMAVAIPGLSSIPIIGVLFRQNPFTYIAYILIPVVYIIFFKTNWGLKIRAVGENPKAAETMGIKVHKIRYISILWASAFAAIGGASQTIGDLGLFVDNMIAGKGYIGFAAIILGRFHPLYTALTVFFFGIVDAFQLNLQAMGSSIPYQFPLMMPYLLTLIAFLIAGSGLAPKAWGSPYILEE